jgi:sigma-B regulation protein RsbU (phosphoserine phosphatase)
MPSELQNLKASSEFLNLLLDNIDAAVLIVDEKLQIHQFNRSFLDLFDRAADQLTLASFGQISGCVNAVRENQPCGSTSQCQFCLLKQSLLQTLTADTPVDRRRLDRKFYIDGQAVRKHLEFSARPIKFQDRQMILVIIYDVTAREQQKRELVAKQATIEADLQAARRIQMSLLPDRDIALPGILTAWQFEPWQLVGGDIFQIYVTNPEEIGAYVLDVCGHGVSAALVAVTVSQFLHSLHNRMRLTGRMFSPREVIDRLEAAFPLDRFNCFFTIVYATLNVRSGRLVYANAGHEPPLILRANGRMETLAHHGTVIGVGLDSPAGEDECRLAAGDRILLYTDGLLDNFGPQGEREGRQLFHDALREFSDRPLDRLLAGIFEQARDLRGGQPPGDDMSLFAIAYRDGE